MFNSSTPTALVVISGTLALTAFACSSERLTSDHQDSISLDKKSQPAVESTKLKSGTPQITLSHKRVPSPQTNSYELALDKAYSAFSISQSAESPDDWHLVASQWQEAITLLKTVPTTGHNKVLAQNKIAEYRRNLTYAQQQAAQQLKENPHSAVAVIPETPTSFLQTAEASVAVPSTVPASQPVFRATITHRIGGTPVINVAFNSTHQFEMIVDTGASQTVITQQMASILGVVPVATAKANTASESNVKFSIGYVRSMQVNGAVIKDVPVAIAPSAELEAGLLGHDFFENYDVTFKHNVVEFRPR